MCGIIGYIGKNDAIKKTIESLKTLEYRGYDSAGITYIENEKNSIKIEIKFKESDKTYAMEAISELGYESFVKNYSNMNFICTKKEYHKKTNQIKYLLFEQI